MLALTIDNNAILRSVRDDDLDPSISPSQAAREVLADEALKVVASGFHDLDFSLFQSGTHRFQRSVSAPPCGTCSRVCSSSEDSVS